MFWDQYKYLFYVQVVLLMDDERRVMSVEWWVMGISLKNGQHHAFPLNSSKIINYSGMFGVIFL